MELQIDEAVIRKLPHVNPRAPTEPQLVSLLQTVGTLLERRCPDVDIQLVRMCMVITPTGKFTPLCDCHEDCGDTYCRLDPPCVHRSPSCASRQWVRREKRKNGSYRQVSQENGGPVTCLFVNGIHMASWVMTKTDKFDITTLVDEALDLADIIELRLTGTWRLRDPDGDRRVALGLDRTPPPTEE